MKYISNIKRVLLVVVAIAATGGMHAADDVDTRIPVSEVVNDKTFVVVISNENYKHEEHVPYALNDGETFAVYCEKTLGVPARNIKLLADATLNDMKHELEWLTKVVQAYEGEASAIVYYSGHGMPDDDSKEAYLLPIDGYSTSPSSGLSTKTLYSQLSAMPSRRTLVFLDACFSGAKRDGTMMAASRGVAIKARNEPVKGNMIVFSAAQAGETAYPYKEYQHGMFTYFVLEKLQQTGGAVSMGDLSDYVIKQVRQHSITNNDKSQTPTMMAGINDKDWRAWQLSEKAAANYEKRTPVKRSQQPNNKDNKGGKLIDRPSTPVSAPAATGGTLNYTMPAYTIEGAGTGVQGTYLVKVTMTAKKPGDVSDQELLRCAIHGVLFRGFNSLEYRQNQRPMAGSALSEQQNANFYNSFFQQMYQQYGQTEPTSRTVLKAGKQYQVTAVVSVYKDQLRKDLTQQGVLKRLANGF